ncbi:hypothetical protein UA08_02770 [Talaromyces atroroseus]|uniref:O-acyltransferase WSD1-like N-terminal domain-containing protein n=1 Tax=Talaromyces atroroseus TaxID=1441469 RepID=A0A225AKS8_TALAT|nr:hypothetical protein UA08_02770 [Talaromyces atroroseus]OKL62171.1 hypothetical protein UA08_02770 [Talaromyces atroroseus]
MSQRLDDKAQGKQNLGDMPSRFIHVQPAERYQTQFYVVSRLGIQSNVIIAATYTSTNGKLSLDKETLYPALKQVVQKYPELGMVSFARPSERKTSQHRRWSGFLRQVNLDDHVKFVEISTEKEREGLRSTIESYHGLWFDDISERPPWSLFVVNGRHAIFVFHHYITDGRGATYVLGSLLEALNNTTPSEQTENHTSPSPSPIAPLTLDVPGFPEKDPVKRARAKLSILWAIWITLKACFIQLSSRVVGRGLFFHDAKPRMFDRLDLDNPQREKFSRTKVESCRLDSELMARCIKACRKHHTSFTSLLHTLLKVTLATDLYPASRYGNSQTVIDLRPYLIPEPRERVMSGCLSVFATFERLSRFREAGAATTTTTAITSTEKSVDIIWDLARKHKSQLNNDLNHTQLWRKVWQSIELLPEEDEGFLDQFLFGYRMLQQNVFYVSNLGVFDPAQFGGDTPGAKWTISNMEFSAGGVKAGYGANLTVNVVAVAGGDTVLYFGSEDGALRDGLVSTLVKNVRARLEAIL